MAQSTASDVLKFTLNIGITSAPLYKLEGSSIPEKHQRHFEKRIGFYTDQRHDTWWTVSNQQEAATAANEVSEILTNRVLPELSTLQTTNDLAALWSKGDCPGLTDPKRKSYLALLGRN